MRAVRQFEKFPLVVREFGSEKELGEAINRGVTYVSERLRGNRDFTFRDKKMILEYLHEPVNRIKEFFPEG